MAFVEHTAAERGYAFSMLWTSSSTSRFYASLGYAVIKAPPKPLSVDTSQLEALLVARTGDVSDVIYMRKRLLDRCRRTRCVVSLNLGKKAVLAVKECPWERQVGPSCGLFALRIAAEIVGGRVECDLLGYARRMGFTAHGELFDASHLVRLAEYLGLGSTLIVDDDWREILPAWFKDGEKKLAIFAYDQGSTHAPVLRSGLAAHYALVLGYIPSTAEVVVVHGLSRVPLVASIDDFIASNAQLSQLNLSDDEDGLCPRSSWVTPASGKPLLARRLVLLESPSSTEKNIVH